MRQSLITETLPLEKLQKLINIPQKIISILSIIIFQVLRMELYAIQSACKKLESGYNPAITFVVVQKRHHTRLFPGDNLETGRDKWRNVPAGTIVDTMITHPTDIDFYLVSHASLQVSEKKNKFIFSK